MTVTSVIALFGAMLITAIIPGPAALTVVARSMAFGFSHGLFITVGIVLGDFVFIILAVMGLSAMAEEMGSLFVLVKYLGGAYLIWMGICLWRKKSEVLSMPNQRSVEQANEGAEQTSWSGNCLSGLAITLSNPKAILFYVSFFPAFVELSTVTITDVGIIMLTATAAFGGVNLAYAYMANKARVLFTSSKAKKRMNLTAGTMMVGTGATLMLRS